MGKSCNNSKKQLCWDCARACGKCPWSDHFAPIKGWTAEKMVMESYYGAQRKDTRKNGITTYWITDCPGFIADSKGCGRARVENNTTAGIRENVRKNSSTKGMNALNKAVINQAVIDWKRAVRKITHFEIKGKIDATETLKQFRDTEKFFSSKWFKAINEVEDSGFDPLDRLYRATGIKRERVKYLADLLEKRLKGGKYGGRKRKKTQRENANDEIAYPDNRNV